MQQRDEILRKNQKEVLKGRSTIEDKEMPFYGCVSIPSTIEDRVFEHKNGLVEAPKTKKHR